MADIEELRRKVLAKRVMEKRAMENDLEAEATRGAEEKYEATRPGKLESAAMGLMQGTTRDWGDEAVAGMRSLKTGESYDDAKLNVDERMKRVQQENPKTYGTAEFAGAAATTPLATNPISMAAMGAADAGARSLGKAKKLDSDALIEGADDAATGGVIGGTLGTLAPYAAKALAPVSEAAGGIRDKVTSWLKDKAGERAVQALRPTQGQMRRLQESGKVSDVGNMMLDEGVVTPFASNKAMSQRAQALPEKFGEQMRPIYEQSKNSRMSPDELTSAVDSRMGELSGDFANKPLVGKLDQYKTDITESGAQSYNPADLGRNRRKLSDTVNYNSDATSQEGTKEMARILREQEMGLIEKIEPELRAKNEALFRKKHLAHLGEEIAPRGEARNSVNNILGLNTVATGGAVAPAMAALGMSAPVVAAVTGGVMAARELARRYGPQMSAVGARKLEQALSNGKWAGIFEEAGKRGPQAIEVAHSMLMKRDPEYKQMIEDTAE